MKTWSAKFWTVVTLTVVAVLLVGASTVRADDAQARARELNNSGNAAYELGNYDEAIDHFTGAYKAYPDARILFNLAQAYRKRQAYDRALELYRNYLRNVPNAANRTAVEELIAELETLVAKQKAADSRPPQGTTATLPEAPPVVSRIEEPRPWYSNALGWSLVGSGVLAAGVGIGFFASASSLEDELAVATDTEKAGLRSDIHTRRTVGAVFTIVGGVAVAGGVTVFLLAPRKVTREIVPIRDLRLSLGPAMLSVAGRF